MSQVYKQLQAATVQICKHLISSPTSCLYGLSTWTFIPCWYIQQHHLMSTNKSPYPATAQTQAITKVTLSHSILNLPDLWALSICTHPLRPGLALPLAPAHGGPVLVKREPSSRDVGAHTRGLSAGNACQGGRGNADIPCTGLPHLGIARELHHAPGDVHLHGTHIHIIVLLMPVALSPKNGILPLQISWHVLCSSFKYWRTWKKCSPPPLQSYPHER